MARRTSYSPRDFFFPDSQSSSATANLINAHGGDPVLQALVEVESLQKLIERMRITVDGDTESDFNQISDGLNGIHMRILYTIEGILISLAQGARYQQPSSCLMTISVAFQSGSGMSVPERIAALMRA
jgi:hypothetical protein